jgi:hypothetical protein
MNRGIYIVGNDRVIDNAIALLNSIRRYDQEVPVYLIPFNDDYQQIAEILTTVHNVQIFPDLQLLTQFTQHIGEVFPQDFLALPNKMRKLVAWFGPLDEFIYIDTDIIVFEKIADNLDKLAKFDFLCCDYHHKNEGLRNVFSPIVKEQKIFTEVQLQDVFNSGFFASKKGTITEQTMENTLRECATHKEYFDFSCGVTDQPVLNYLILKLINKRCNLVRTPDGEAGSWAGSPHFQEKDFILYDRVATPGEYRTKKLKYVHWAGMKMKPGTPYYKLWEHYRHLHEPKRPLLQRLLHR